MLIGIKMVYLLDRKFFFCEFQMFAFRIVFFFFFVDMLIGLFKLNLALKIMLLHHSKLEL